MRRLLPEPASEVTIEEAYAASLGEHSDRLWCSLCMVASIDGSIALDGLSTGLSSTNDLAILVQLRRIADVIIVGAGTVRAEGYGVPSKPGQRVGVVTNSGEIDLTWDLFASGAGFVVTTRDATVPDGVDVLRVGTDRVDPAEMLRRLGEICDRPQVVQAEGGALLNGSFLDADLLDEINLTTSPLAVGGSGPRLTAGAVETAARYELAQMVVDEQSLMYSRWLRGTAD